MSWSKSNVGDKRGDKKAKYKITNFEHRNNKGKKIDETKLNKKKDQRIRPWIPVTELWKGEKITPYL